MAKQPKIIQISAAIPTSATDSIIYGLGDDNQVYWWDTSLKEWALYI